MRFLSFVLLTLSCADAGHTPQVYHGVEYLKLETVAHRLNMSMEAIADEKWSLRSKWSQLDFELHNRDFYLNGIRVFLAYPISLWDDAIWISKTDYENTVRTIVAPRFTHAADKLYRIVIDPGHGGNDPGAQNIELKMREKDIVLDLSEGLKQALEKIGYEVMLTRNDDTFIPLKARADFANEVGSDFFISLHVNAIESPEVHGVETYTLTPVDQPSTSALQLDADAELYVGNQYDAQSQLAGYIVHTGLVRELGAFDRGLKRAKFGVLKHLNCPGMLIEAGFVSNPEEARKLQSKQYQESIIKALVHGIRIYHDAYNRLRR